MKFIFKMFVLVGMILVGKFMKDEPSNEVGKKGEIKTSETYSLNAQEATPVTKQTNNSTTPTTKKEDSEKTFTYAFN
ncbi:hypothetical protein EFA69_04635 [Rufibacter immobilis]|uniref:Uncharacterized protein n=1 Tax=Rufibacter immobilis TaxID=1348778 RepID=A0A3M9N4F2_9BACT|nr:hypothetical protein [Rufibacter immobilis]RNI32609.1 hypothetical protein EFA69_04635 [Rufibacter immobilis]